MQRMRGKKGRNDLIEWRNDLIEWRNDLIEWRNHLIRRRNDLIRGRNHPFSRRNNPNAGRNRQFSWRNNPISRSNDTNRRRKVKRSSDIASHTKEAAYKIRLIKPCIKESWSIPWVSNRNNRVTASSTNRYSRHLPQKG